MALGHGCTAVLADDSSTANLQTCCRSIGYAADELAYITYSIPWQRPHGCDRGSAPLGVRWSWKRTVGSDARHLIPQRTAAVHEYSAYNAGGARGQSSAAWLCRSARGGLCLPILSGRGMFGRPRVRAQWRARCHVLHADATGGNYYSLALSLIVMSHRSRPIPSHAPAAACAYSSRPN